MAETSCILNTERKETKQLPKYKGSANLLKFTFAAHKLLQALNLTKPSAACTNNSALHVTQTAYKCGIV